MFQKVQPIGEATHEMTHDIAHDLSSSFGVHHVYDAMDPVAQDAVVTVLLSLFCALLLCISCLCCQCGKGRQANGERDAELQHLATESTLSRSYADPPEKLPLFAAGLPWHALRGEYRLAHSYHV